MQTITKRFWPAFALILLLIFIATGCGTGNGGMAETAVSVVERITPRFNLPRITITFDEAGAPKIFGVRLATIGRLILTDLSGVALPADTLSQLQNGNIQHIELDLNADGVFIYVNGKGLPYIAWSEERLTEIGNLIDKTGAIPNSGIIAKAMPLLGRIGIDIVLKFPPAAGAEEIPVRDRKDRQEVQAVTLEEPTATIQALIEYGPDGVPTIAGISTREISQVAGSDLSGIELTPEQLALIKAGGIQNLAIVTAGDGLRILINEKDLLHLAYDEEHLKTAVELYARFSGGATEEEILTFINNLTPILSGADIDIVATFPS